MLKAAAYARYSTDNQTDNSIAYKFEKINKYSEENNIEIVKYYADEACSDTNTDRIGCMQMCEGARNKDFKAVIIYDTSRGSRNIADWFNFRKEMRKLDILVISTSRRLGNIANPNDFLVELISVGLGEHQVLDTRQKSIDVWQ